jgi:hypothetical protein
MLSFIHNAFSLTWSETYYIRTIFVGYSLSVIVGGTIIWWFFHLVRKRIPQRDKGYEWLNSWFVGPIEIILIITSLLNGFPEFIGVWIIFKAAIRWSRYEKHEPKSENTLGYNPRLADHLYIIGNGLVIIYSISGYLTIKWWLDEKSQFITIVLTLIAIFTLAIIIGAFLSPRVVVKLKNRIPSKIVLSAKKRGLHKINLANPGLILPNDLKIFIPGPYATYFPCKLTKRSEDCSVSFNTNDFIRRLRNHRFSGIIPLIGYLEDINGNKYMSEPKWFDIDSGTLLD